MSRRGGVRSRSEEHTSELQSPCNLVCRLLLEKKKNNTRISPQITTRGRIDQISRTPAPHMWVIVALAPVTILVIDPCSSVFFFFFFFNDTATTEIYTLSLHDALPI